MTVFPKLLTILFGRPGMLITASAAAFAGYFYVQSIKAERDISHIRAENAERAMNLAVKTASEAQKRVELAQYSENVARKELAERSEKINAARDECIDAQIPADLFEDW